MWSCAQRSTRPMFPCASSQGCTHSDTWCGWQAVQSSSSSAPLPRPTISCCVAGIFNTSLFASEQQQIFYFLSQSRKTPWRPETYDIYYTNYALQNGLFSFCVQRFEDIKIIEDIFGDLFRISVEEGEWQVES